MYDRYDNAISRAREKELVINGLNKKIKQNDKQFDIVGDFLKQNSMIDDFVNFRKLAIKTVAKTVQKSFGMER